ncbi:c-type cytochrome biogenesis protein CcsB [Brevibacillus dissolubilis]|uniref:c-type cytochrome biogenesis protein CcsB n=1 Tax=Brevibacillus dissolubilis TaxID=1844116 RepID=UPI0011164394|nr:c-type cytochrome biogenesis protein CcsB [Brevibacillus dissolubilis]
MIQLSNNLLLLAFVLYLVSTIVYAVAITGKKWANRDPKEHQQRFGRIGFAITFIGFLSQTGYVAIRWIAGGHSPTSNMFEFIAFLSYCIVIGFLILYRIYRMTILGAFAVPLAAIMLAYASVFPKEVTPLIPALQSYWLQIHVTTAALGEGILAVGFASGLMYLIRTVPQQVSTKSTKWLEFVISVVLMMVGFIIVSTVFANLNQKTVFEFPQYKADEPTVVERMLTVEYKLPAIVAPQESKIVQPGPITPLFEAPGFMEGKDAARKLNTMIWSVLSGVVLYGLIRLLLRKRLAAAMQPTLDDIDPELIDEISYRAIAIGYPIFTLGALIFAMIWANEAWGRFWGWDPKEVWALIVWLFYSAYLHLRLSKGWLGVKSAWMAVAGFVIILITLVVVNLVIAGLHSYAGV